jgi:putative NADH-flavin reductase
MIAYRFILLAYVLGTLSLVAGLILESFLFSASHLRKSWALHGPCPTGDLRRRPRLPKEEFMRLFLLGATGGIGRHLVRIALDRGHCATAYVRSPAKIIASRERLKVVAGDAFNVDQLAQALPGHDAVLSAFGPRTVRHTTMRRDFARGLVASMRLAKIERLLLVSAALLFPNVGILGALLKSTLFHQMAPDMAGMESEIKKSGLLWTIVRPPRLTNGPAAKTPSRVEDGRLPEGGRTISRVDVARFLICEAESPMHLHQIVGISK